MNYRLLTNIIATLALIAFIAWCIVIFKTTGWAGLLGIIAGFITISIIKTFRNRRNNP